MIEVDNALKRLKEAVEEDQLSSIEAPQDCCVDGHYQENIRFRTQVRVNKLLWGIAVLWETEVKNVKARGPYWIGPTS